MHDLIVSGVLLLLLDSVFLFLIADIFSKQVESVQKSKIQVDFMSAAICYLILILGIYFFIIRERRSPIHAFLLGVFVYGVYETTSKSLLSKWNWNTVFIDTLWGGLLFALTAFFTYKILDVKWK